MRNAGASLLEINGTEDHVHLLVRCSKSMCDQDFIAQVKRYSAKWVNDSGFLTSRFAWQAGYGWFSVGAKQLSIAQEYVRKQKEHHKKVSYEEELLTFLQQYKVEYDERYLWS